MSAKRNAKRVEELWVRVKALPYDNDDRGSVLAHFFGALGSIAEGKTVSPSWSGRRLLDAMERAIIHAEESVKRRIST